MTTTQNQNCLDRETVDVAVASQILKEAKARKRAEQEAIKAQEAENAAREAEKRRKAYFPLLDAAANAVRKTHSQISALLAQYYANREAYAALLEEVSTSLAPEDLAQVTVEINLAEDPYAILQTGADTIASLEGTLDETREALRNAKAQNLERLEARDLRIAELETQLATANRTADTAGRESGARVRGLEDQIRQLRQELSTVKASQEDFAAKYRKAIAAWKSAHAKSAQVFIDANKTNAVSAG